MKIINLLAYDVVHVDRKRGFLHRLLIHCFRYLLKLSTNITNSLNLPSDTTVIVQNIVSM